LFGLGVLMRGNLNTKTNQSAFDLGAAQRVIDEQNGELTLPERLRCRIRYFTDGVILGSQSFVELHFGRLKQKLSYRRQHAARRLTVLGSTTLWVFCDLRARAIG
jgi:REP-associated tyrosine transposase